MTELIIGLVVTFIFLFIIGTVNGVIWSKRPYACPNCGYIFTMKWYSLIFKTRPMVNFGDEELKLRCPSCRKIDFCKHTTQGEVR